MITEDYVSFETAKLLKEKGFDEATIGYYPIVGKAKESFHKGASYRWNYFSDRSIAAPTLQMAAKWLRKEHNLHVQVEAGLTAGVFWYDFDIIPVGNDDIVMPEEVEISVYSEPEEALEVGIKYALENLI